MTAGISELEWLAELIAALEWTRADLRAALDAGERADGSVADRLAWRLKCLGDDLPTAEQALAEALERAREAGRW